MVVTGLLEGRFEPLAYADVYNGPVTDRLVVVAGLKFERKLIWRKAGGLKELAGAKITRIRAGEPKTTFRSPVRRPLSSARAGCVRGGRECSDQQPERRELVLWEDLDAVRRVHICIKF
jgi:hypothetical protein